MISLTLLFLKMINFKSSVIGKKRTLKKLFDICVSNFDDCSSFSEDFEPEVLERLNLAGYSGAKKLFDVISIPENMRERFKEMFSGFYLVDSLKPDDFCDSLKSINFKRIVSVDGRVLIKKFHGGK